MKNTFFALLLICLAFTAFKCDDDDASVGFEEDKKELISLQKTIEDLADASVCNETTECKFIAFGSKPCGGAWSYLIYSTSINVEELESMVADYNQKQADFNTKYGVISDCSAVMPPTGMKCENNTCIPIY